MSELVNKGYAGALGIAVEETPGDAVTPPTTFLEIESETFDEERNWEEAKGIHGVRSKSLSDEAETTLDPKGGFVLPGVKGADMDLILQLLLGSYSSGTGYLGDELNSFTVVVNKPPNYDVYAGCKMASGRFEASQDAQALKFTSEIAAMTLVEGNAASLGTPSYANEIPMTFRRATFSVAGSPVYAKSFNLTVANALDTEVYRNSQTRIAIPENDERDVSGELAIDWNTANYTAFMDRWRAPSYAEFQAEFTNGVYNLTFVCPNCRYPSERGKIADKGLIDMPVKFVARASATGQQDELQVLLAAV